MVLDDEEIKENQEALMDLMKFANVPRASVQLILSAYSVLATTPNKKLRQIFYDAYHAVDDLRR